MKALVRYDWPGNVRELRNVVEYAFILCQEGFIKMAHLPPHLSQQAKNVKQPRNNGYEAERSHLIELLQQMQGNQSEAARRLNVSRVKIWNRIKKYGINIPKDLKL